jgi:hypothetical protein
MLIFFLKTIVALEICNSKPGLGQSCTTTTEDGAECATRCQDGLMCNGNTCVDSLNACTTPQHVINGICGVVREGHHGATCLKSCTPEYECQGPGLFHWNDTATCAYKSCQATSIQGESCGFGTENGVNCKRTCQDGLICNGGYCALSIPDCGHGPALLDGLCGLTSQGPHGALCTRNCADGTACIGNLAERNQARCQVGTVSVTSTQFTATQTKTIVTATDSPTFATASGTSTGQPSSDITRYPSWLIFSLFLLQ